jgi:hypothetical protein
VNVRYQYIVLFVFALISIKFYDAQFIDDKILEYANFFGTIAVTILALKFVLTTYGGFSGPIKLILLSVLLSLPMAYLTWGQPIRDTMIETVPHFIWILIFLLIHYRISIRAIESIVLCLGILYVLLYFFQLANSPTVLFGKSLWGDEFTVDRNVTRIIFPAAGVFILSVFISISKLTTQKRFRWFWLIMVVLGVVIPIMQVTRQFTAGILLFYLVHFIRGRNILAKGVVFLAFFIALFIALEYSKNPMIQGMVAAQQRDLNLGSDYIRVQAGKFFLTEFSPTPVNRFLGNGVPNYGFSSYGKYVEKLAVTKGYFLSDVGIIAVYAMFGILAVIGFVLIWIKSFTIKVPPKYVYVKYYLWYLLFTSLTWFSLYSFHYLISTVFVLYIYHVIKQRTVQIITPDGHTVEVFVPLSEDVQKYVQAYNATDSTKQPEGPNNPAHENA